MVNDLVDQGEPDKKSLFKNQNKSADKEFKKINWISLLVSRFASKFKDSKATTWSSDI